MTVMPPPLFLDFLLPDLSGIANTLVGVLIVFVGLVLFVVVPKFILKLIIGGGVLLFGFLGIFGYIDYFALFGAANIIAGAMF